jgi:hypothetical protein
MASTMYLGAFLDSLKSKKSKKMIEAWTDSEIRVIGNSFEKATKRLKLKAPSSTWSKASPQSRGNIMANLVIEELSISRSFRLKQATTYGAGYPDSLLENTALGTFIVELKATKAWNEKDGNRRVLLSSTTKLEKILYLEPNVKAKHLLLTCIHDDEGMLTELRLDFLNPDTVINTRFEAATNHKLLSGSVDVSRNVKL